MVKSQFVSVGQKRRLLVLVILNLKVLGDKLDRIVDIIYDMGNRDSKFNLFLSMIHLDDMVIEWN